MKFAEKYPLKSARMRARVSLAQVSASANCAVNTVLRYEVAPDSVQHAKRFALDAVYGRFTQKGIAV